MKTTRIANTDYRFSAAGTGYRLYDSHGFVAWFQTYHTMFTHIERNAK